MFMKLFFGSILLLCATSALANESWVEVEIPQIDVAEYHRPYVAIWFQNQTTNEVHNIAVWYQLPTARAAGESG